MKNVVINGCYDGRRELKTLPHAIMGLWTEYIDGHGESRGDTPIILGALNGYDMGYNMAVTFPQKRRVAGGRALSRRNSPPHLTLWQNNLADSPAEMPNFAFVPHGATLLTKLKTMDKLTPEQRHRCMAAIKARDTRPELLVRRYLWACGFRYRLNDRRLPGHPDVVLRRYRTVIFINGCFWHGHEGCPYYRLPQTRTAYWRDKIARNQARDAEEQRELSRMGWHCIVVWECQLKPAAREATLRALVYTLSHLYLEDHRVALHTLTERREQLAVAEPETAYGARQPDGEAST